MILSNLSIQNFSSICIKSTEVASLRHTTSADDSIVIQHYQCKYHHISRQITHNRSLKQLHSKEKIQAVNKFINLKLMFFCCVESDRLKKFYKLLLMFYFHTVRLLFLDLTLSSSLSCHLQVSL